jgi:hypothetical protein
VLPTADRCIDPGVRHFSYERMNAKTTEVEGASHVVMISSPGQQRGGVPVNSPLIVAE